MNLEPLLDCLVHTASSCFNRCRSSSTRAGTHGAQQDLCGTLRCTSVLHVPKAITPPQLYLKGRANSARGGSSRRKLVHQCAHNVHGESSHRKQAHRCVQYARKAIIHLGAAAVLVGQHTASRLAAAPPGSLRALWMDPLTGVRAAEAVRLVASTIARAPKSVVRVPTAPQRPNWVLPCAVCHATM